MGLPRVVFTTARSANSTVVYGDNVYGEIKNDKTPRVGTFSNGSYQLDSFDIQRVHTTTSTFSQDEENNWTVSGTATETWYGNFSSPGASVTWSGTNTSSGGTWTSSGSPPTRSPFSSGTSTSGIRSNLGTFPLSGGGFEQMEFDTGAGTSSVTAQQSGAGVFHNYVAFVNTGDGGNTLKNYTGGNYSVTATSPAQYGPKTLAYDNNAGTANIEFDVSWTSSALQAGAGAMGWNDTTQASRNAVDNNGHWYASAMTYTPFEDNEEGGDTPAAAYFSTFYGDATGPASVRRGPSISGTGNSPNIQADVTIAASGEPGEENYVPGSTISDKKHFAFASAANAAIGVTLSMIPEIWYPGLSHSSSSSGATAWKGSIEFKVMPDTEHTMSANMVATTVTGTATYTAHLGGGPIGTHSRVTFTCGTTAHNMSDNQNQVAISGATNPTHVNGLWNVSAIVNSTAFSYDIPFSTASGTSPTVSGTLSVVLFDGIDKTGAVVKSGTSVVGEVVHGGNAGNNKVILRGDVSLSGTHTIHSNSISPAIATVTFTGGRTYRSLFHEAGLYLNESTGQVTSNGTFDGINSTKGLRELDGYFPKYKNGRDYAINQVKTDGLIYQEPMAEGADSDHVKLINSTNLPTKVFFKQLTYANGFSANISYFTSNTSFVVQHFDEFGGEDAGHPYTSISYNDISFPTPNTSSYRAMKRADNLRIIDPDDTSSTPNILTYVSTTEMFNTPVHFTIRAMKKTSHGPTGSSTKTISGWGTYENGADNFVDGKLFIRVYNNTDADIVSIMAGPYGDANNNVDITNPDFNRNDTAKKINEEPVTDTQFLQNNYSNGNFTVIDSI